MDAVSPTGKGAAEVARGASESPHVPMVSLLTRDRWIEIGRIVLTGIVVVLFWRDLVPTWVLWLAVTVGLYPLVKTGILDLIRERRIGTEIFVTIATLIALIGGEAIAGAVLMVIILIAEFIAELNTDRARASIRGLVGSIPQTAILREEGRERTVSIDQLRPGNVVLVRAGEKVPVDGQVSSGNGSVNEAPITGESVPKDKAEGSAVFAGTVLESGAIEVRTEKAGADTTFARIVKLVEEAEESQAPVQKLADRVSAWLIPVVFLFLLVVFLFTHDVRKIVTLMIFTSPAELGLATPMVMIAAIARAARSGILIKGGVYLETLARVDAMVFDKTGTLTIGKPKVVGVVALANPGGENEVLRIAAAADRRSSHPLALAVVERAKSAGIEFPEPDSFEAIQGRGVKATVEGKPTLVGNEALLRESGLEPPTNAAEPGATAVYVVLDGRPIGILQIADEVRPGAREAIAKLRATGVRQIAMLTGDNRATAKAVADAIGVDQVFPELLPEAKVAAISELQKKGFRVAMIGDGVNDAPALAKADVGIAMGAGGTQAAIEAADIALMTDDLGRIVTARAIARRAYRTIQENLIFGVGVVHVLGITAALLGWIGPIQAAMIHLGPDILVFLNSVKLLRVSLE
ncbi:MAG: cation-translocating P-type ATPase [Acidobacteriota bacterium]